MIKRLLLFQILLCCLLALGVTQADAQLGGVTCDSLGPPTWTYILTHIKYSITEWTYSGSNITGATAPGGWGSAYTSTSVTFTIDAGSLESGSVSGFQIHGDGPNGAGNWVCHDSSGTVAGSLPVELSSFVATTGDNGKVTLRWRTETEMNNIGFRIYRGEKKDGKFVKINKKLIPGQGSKPMPTDYEFVDKTTKPGRVYYYYLEDIDVAGNREKSEVVNSRKPVNVVTMWGKLKKIK